MSRKILCLITCVILTSALAACSSAPSAAEASPSPAATAAPAESPSATPAETPEAPAAEETPAVEADAYYTSTTESSFNGPLTVKIGVTDGKIVSAEISAEEESLGGTMMKEYETAIVQVGAADMDAIDALSGATTQFTKDAIHTALEDCFTQAGLETAG